ncbi:MAG: amidophosphoribosyltransferase [Bacteroidetes bacterium]|nr:amidophosphoribosyltransferase [Bacteroidota bacterium]
MTDEVKHECGIALIRLLKPLEYYRVKYGTWQYGLKKLCLLMEKQHNRGQDGAGAVCIKLDVKPGRRYIHRIRSRDSLPIKDIFRRIYAGFGGTDEKNPDRFNDALWAKENIPFAGELYLGHLRYGTFGKHSLDYVHPVMRENNLKSRNLVLAGNFNLTNTDELFNTLVNLGQHPKEYTDTVTILEKVGHYLDEENQLLFRQYKNEGYKNVDISLQIEENLNIRKVLEKASQDWDGGYTVAGMIGYGDAFIARDPWGIRPAFYYSNGEIIVVASERPAIQTVLNVGYKEVKEIRPGFALIIKKNGSITEEQIRVPQQVKSCSFERIYFSRGTDLDIYKERKKLGELLTPAVLKAVENDIENTVFSFIPNTAETAFLGLVKGIESYLTRVKKEKISKLKNPGGDKLDAILNMRPRVEKIAVKDVKMRTFISEDNGRDDLVTHVYDVTYGIVRDGIDNLVVVDDSIVRGTTLKQSILQILDRLCPKRIVIVSSAPQIRYPDCYGIDMAKLGDFVAFRAAIQLLKDTGRENIINEVYKKSKEQQYLPKEEMVNYVKQIYKPFTGEQLSEKIAQLLKPKNIRAEIKIVYQTISDLHTACPDHTGDWYFTGNYPTPGGNKVVNTAFINFIEDRNERAY